MTPAPQAPLRHLYPAWFAIVLGLCGLALAWHRASVLMGDGARLVSQVLGALAGLVLTLLTVAFVVRAIRHPDVWREDRRHPVRHAFIAALPISWTLLATVATSLGLRHPTITLIWMTGALAQLLITAWVLGRGWLGNRPGGFQWTAITPALFIPVVGNVLLPLAGHALGLGEWAMAQFGIGLLFWPIVLVLLLVRIGVQGIWPERLLPATFIVIAPPAVIGLVALQAGAPLALAWMCWGIALFGLLWVLPLLKRIAALPFGLAHWGMSFPLAALSALTLALWPRTVTPLPALGLLALSTLVIAALSYATLQGLRQGSLLTAEPLPPVVAVSDR